MKFLNDFFPILLFFLTFWFYDRIKALLVGLGVDPSLLTLHDNSSTEGILAATAVAVLASLLQVGISRFRYHRVENMQVITLLLLVLLGGATLIFQEEIFIKWKPTVVNWLFALVFWGSGLVGRKKPLVQRMMEKNIQLPPPVWRRLNLAWVVFFLAMGLLNLYVIYHFSTEIWVNFKLFGLMGLTLVFVVGQSLYLVRFINSDP